MIREITPGPGNPHLALAELDDVIHLLNPVPSATNWFVQYDHSLFQYTGVNPVNNPGTNGWTFLVINVSSVPTVFLVRTVPGLPLDRNAIIDLLQFPETLIIHGTCSFSNVIEGIALSSSEEPEEFVPLGPRSFQRGAFQIGAFQ